MIKTLGEATKLMTGGAPGLDLVLPLVIWSFQSLTKPGVRVRKMAGERYPFAHNPNLHAVVLFCVAGLLLTLNVVLRFPDLGRMIAQYNQF